MRLFAADMAETAPGSSLLSIAETARRCAAASIQCCTGQNLVQVSACSWHKKGPHACAYGPLTIGISKLVRPVSTGPACSFCIGCVVPGISCPGLSLAGPAGGGIACLSGGVCPGVSLAVSGCWTRGGTYSLVSCLHGEDDAGAGGCCCSSCCSGSGAGLLAGVLFGHAVSNLQW